MKTLFNTIGVCLFLNVTTTSSAIPTESFGHGRSNKLLHIKSEEQRLTFSEQFGFDALPAPTIKYGPLDFAMIFLEDETRVANNEPRRVAMKRKLNLLASDGEWLRVPNGWLWRVEILCESSLGVNLHFTDFNLPEGAKMIVYNVHDPSDAHGPFTGTGDFGTGEIWTASIGTNRIRIEYLVPLSNQRVFSKTLPFFLADLHDVYIDFLGGVNGRFGDMSCYEDPVCHAEWVDPAKGMALILINNSGACSGGLLATTLQDETPYYYTAHHCVESTSEANSLVFYFGYQALTCGGSIYPGTIVSGGAELVDASPTSSDGNTLVMIRHEIPREIYFPGWTMGGFGYGTNTTGLHFPAASYMRISLGDYVGGTSTLAYQDWTPTDGHGSGSAEPGSSGSHIFKDSDQQVYGALFGGSGTGGCSVGVEGLFLG